MGFNRFEPKTGESWILSKARQRSFILHSIEKPIEKKDKWHQRLFQFIYGRL